MSHDPVNIQIIIDNPVLLKILQWYVDCGMSLSFNKGFGVGTYVDAWGNPQEIKYILHARSRTPAFYFEVGFDDGSWKLKPGFFEKGTKILDRVLEDVVIRALDGILYQTDLDYPDIVIVYDKPLYEQLKIELLGRKDEINQAYKYIYWWNNQKQIGSLFDEEYEYDPINGETYSYKGDPEEHYF